MPWLPFGNVSVLALLDAAGPHFNSLDEAFPTATPQDWRRAAEIDPGVFAADGSWRLHFRCFAVRLDDGRTMLIDAGIGPADSLAASWAPVPGQLPARLAEAGIEPADIDTVVLTHLHSDHFGWAVAGGQPLFPNASYLLQQADFDKMGVVSPRVRGTLLDPLQASGQLRLVDGRTQLAAEVTAVPTPGHTPGHQSVLVTSRGDEVLVTGDLLVHPVQLADPSIAYLHDDDPDTARSTRIRMLADARARGAMLATAHLSRAFLPPPTSG